MTTFELAVSPPSPFIRLLSIEHDLFGVGRDLGVVEQRVLDLQAAYQNSPAITDREAVLAEAFRVLADEWRSSRRFRSSLTEITEHPAYRAIVQLGNEVVPVLLRELQQRPEPWFAALREITGHDPVRSGQRGDMKAMRQAWLSWGRDRGLIR